MKAKPLANITMEYESGSAGLTYRYTYGLEKSSVVIYGITTGAGSVAQDFTYPNGKEKVVKLYYHHDRLGSTDYLTDNVSGKVTSYVTYDDWGAPTMKPIIKLGLRELDLVTEYTGHMYDQLLSVYYARARMYDAADRRFMAVDPVKGSITNVLSIVQYTYCLDNPKVYIDLTGLGQTDTKQQVNSYEKPGNNNYVKMGPEPIPISTVIAPTAGSIVSKSDGYYFLTRYGTSIKIETAPVNWEKQRLEYLQSKNPYVAMQYALTPEEMLDITIRYNDWDKYRDPKMTSDGVGLSDELIYSEHMIPSPFMVNGFIPSMISWWEADPIGFDIQYPLEKHKMSFFEGLVNGNTLLGAITCQISFDIGNEKMRNDWHEKYADTQGDYWGTENAKRGTGSVTGGTGNATADVRKFSEYIFKDGAAQGKDIVFKELGYTANDSQMLTDLYKQQAAIKYAANDYTLGRLDSFGQRINIEIELNGVGNAAGKTSYIKSGWMIQPDGSISLNTPFTGFTR